MKKTKNFVLIGIIIVIASVLCVLFATNKISFNKDEDSSVKVHEKTSDTTDNTINEDEDKVLYLYTSGDSNAAAGNPETLKIYKMDDTKLKFQYHAQWNEKDITGFAQKTDTNKYAYDEGVYRLEITINDDSVEVNEYTNEQLTSTVNLFK